MIPSSLWSRQMSRLLPALTLILLLLSPPAQAAPQADTYKSLETFANVLNILENNYVDEVDSQKLVEGAIKGMLNSLDPHSSFLKPEDFKELQVETKGSFTGIGIEVTIVDGILTVVSPIEGAPAFEKGLKAGDKILKIDNESTQDMNLMDAVKKLRGPKGTEVTISVFREGWTDLQEFVIVRDLIPLQSVKAKMLDSDYGYARITNFQAKTTRDLSDALKELAGKNTIKGLILDLRNNPGGLLDQAIRVSDLFLREGVIVTTQGRIADQNYEYKAHSFGDHFDYPMIVLVNEGSASASEIVAGAMQDNKRALILGSQTFGKGSVQTIIPMPNGAGLRLTTARYYTPNGTSIQAKGITPDIVVASVIEEEPNPTEKDQPKFIREQDLKHHISNGIAPEHDESENPEIKGIQPDDKTQKNMEQKKDSTGVEELQKDRQLYTALLLMKGFDVFSGLQE